MATTKVRGTQVSNVALLDAANIFTANQRVNAGLGVNVAPGATGEIKTSAGLYERSRTTAIGGWINAPYAAGNFTASGSMVWTVGSGDVSVSRYQLTGDGLYWFFIFDTTSVSGTPSTDLIVTIPGGFTAVSSDQVPAILYENATFSIGKAFSLGTTVVIRHLDNSNWSAATNATAMSAFIPIKI